MINYKRSNFLNELNYFDENELVQDMMKPTVGNFLPVNYLFYAVLKSDAKPPLINNFFMY